MRSQLSIRWAGRVRPLRVRRLYDLNKRGLFGDALLEEVGWTLYARCQDILTVCRAVFEGELPCPECGEAVYRRRHRAQAPAGIQADPPGGFQCPLCRQQVTWRQCRDALRRAPRCFDCTRPLRWQYSRKRLRCPDCSKDWSWEEYLRSVKGRVWLPCASCGRRIRRPEPTARQKQDGRANATVETVECPKCHGAAGHAGGQFRCGNCGYEIAWAKYRKRMKRRAEHLQCSSCGFAFTWKSWRSQYIRSNLLTGAGIGPVREFVSAWERCKTPQQQMIKIDGLLHAVHGQGTLGPLLIDADERSVARLLDDLAQQRA